MRDALRSGRVADAYARLKDEIRTARMPPGFQATEPEIALRLGMSRTPVREALVRLEAEGLIRLIPRRGARVLPIRPEDMREIYQILTSLEPDAAASVAARCPSAADLAPLEATTAEMESALGETDLERWADADDRFHLSLLDLQGNNRLKSVVMALFDQAHRARIVTLRMRNLPVKSTEEHREILEHLRQGNAEAARRVFRQHRERAARELMAILEKYKLGQL
ncbi:MAG: GntR family transcriptional regulator [Pseudomonadota bacterium]